MVGWRGGLNRRVISSVIRRSEWGYHDNTTHLFFWFCNKKQLNFGHFNTNSKKFFETVNFFQKEAKTAPKRSMLFCLLYQGVFGHFTTIYFRRFLKTNEEVRPLPKMSEEPSKHLTVFPSETVNIKKLANLTANTKNYGQITLNTKPHSDLLINIAKCSFARLL